MTTATVTPGQDPGEFIITVPAYLHGRAMEDLTPAFLRDLDEDAGRLKAKLMFGKRAVAFLGTLVCALEWKWDLTVPRAAVDGIHIFWNPFWFVTLNEEQKLFVLEHELWHVGYDHMARLRDHQPDLANQAADHVINLDLIHNANYQIGDMMDWICCDKRFDGMAYEQVYDILAKEQPPTPPPPPQQGPGPCTPNGSGGQGQPQPQLPGNQPGQAPQSPAQGENAHAAAGAFRGDLRPVPEGKQAEAMGNVIRAVQAAQMAGQAGSIPGAINEMLDKFLNPRLPWNQIVQQFLTELARDDFSYRRPSRRSEEIIMPSLLSDGNLQKLGWAIDTSGSMYTALLKQIFGEARYVRDMFKPEGMTIVQFDCAIQQVDDFDEEIQLEDVKLHGRGGTDMEPVYDWIMENKPTAMIIFSDMYCEKMRKDPGIPIIWIAMGDQNWTPPFGQVAYIDPKDIPYDA